MKALLCVVGLIQLLLSAPSMADPSVSKILAEHPNKNNSVYLAGVFAGLEWANTILAADHQAQLFCSPPKLSMTNYVHERDRDREYPVGLILLKAAQNVFPCQK